MKSISHNSKRRTDRHGLSIVEVLTSIVVAMIGVFGVMVLIPFAVKQAQSGLDKDAAVIVARNAYSQFEIAGYRFPSNWGVHRNAAGRIGGNGNGTVNAYSPYEPADTDGDGFQDDVNGDGFLTVADADPPMVFSIDPIGINANLNGTTAADYAAAYNNSFFPFNRRNSDPNNNNQYPNGTGAVNLLITPANLGSPTGALMGQAMAQRMFFGNDNLVFGDAADDLLGPEQYFDLAVAGATTVNTAKRQADSRLSWSAIVVPYKDDPLLAGTNRWSYKMYILVYRDRQPNIASSTAEDAMSYALVDVARTGSSGLNSPVSNIELHQDITDLAIARDDWVMLINQDLSVNAEAGFDKQIDFYRVVSASSKDPNDNTTRSSLTLDGPDFRFDDGSGNLSNTYVVHLANVIGVYERTFEPEFESIWTTRGGD